MPFTLNDILSDRSEVVDTVSTQMNTVTRAWGIQTNFIRIDNIRVDSDMERALAKRAEAERDQEASIIRAQGELASVEALTRAAEQISGTPFADKLRELQTLERISKEPGQHTILVPWGMGHMAPLAQKSQNQIV